MPGAEQGPQEQVTTGQGGNRSLRRIEKQEWIDLCLWTNGQIYGQMDLGLWIDVYRFMSIDLCLWTNG